MPITCCTSAAASDGIANAAKAAAAQANERSEVGKSAMADVPLHHAPPDASLGRLREQECRVARIEEGEDLVEGAGRLAIDAEAPCHHTGERREERVRRGYEGDNVAGERAKVEETGFKLDPAKIAALQQDTERVSALLANIFTEAEEKAKAYQKENPKASLGEAYKAVFNADKDLFDRYMKASTNTGASDEE